MREDWRTPKPGGASVGSWRASFRFFACIGTMNLEQVRGHRQGAAGILPAVLFSDWSAGKMPAALWGSWGKHSMDVSDCRVAVLVQDRATPELKLYLFQKAQALRDLFNRRRRFVFDEIPFHAGLLGRAQDGGPIHDPGAERNVVGHLGMTGEESGRSPLLHVFDVHQLEALAVCLEQLYRVLAWMNNPEHVHFVADKVGLGFSHQQ